MELKKSEMEPYFMEWRKKSERRSKVLGKSEGSAGWSELLWNGAKEARGGARFYGMERRKRGVERALMEWSEGSAGRSDMGGNGGKEARREARSYGMERRTRGGESGQRESGEVMG